MKHIFFTSAFIFAFAFILVGSTNPSFSQESVPAQEMVADELNDTIDAKQKEAVQTIQDTVGKEKNTTDQTPLPTSTPPATEVDPNANTLFDTVADDNNVKEAKQTTREVADAITEKTKETEKKSSQFLKDLKQARDILVGEEKESKPLLRGMILPFFQPVFLLVMMTFGLWSGQLREKLSAVWVIPMTVVAAMVTAAFITVFIPDLRPNVSLGESGNILDRASIDTAAVIPAILLGLTVGLGLRMVPVIAFVFAAAIGLFFGFTKITDISPYSVDFVLFWVGFGVTSLIFSIFGLGLQDFFKTMGANIFIKVFGFITVLSGVGLAIAVF